MLKVEMLSTGDEVLYGQIIDTNAAWLADYLFNQGLPLARRNTVGDNLHDLIAILRERSHEADILIVNGGLGPTSDDLSALAAATAAGVELVENAQWLKTMEAFFAKRGRVMAPSNRKQALIPANSEMIDNPVGTACGFAMQLNRCLIFFTPGVPSEFKEMVAREIMPRLQSRFELPEPPVCLRLTTFGRGESDLAQSLDTLVLPDDVVMGYRSSMPIIELKLTGPATQRTAMEAIWPEVRRVAGDSLIFEGTEALPAQIARRLREQSFTLTLSEQFTGGLVALQLSREAAPVLASEVLPAQIQTLADTLDHGIALRKKQIADIALVIAGTVDDQVNFALITENDSYGLGVQFGISHHSLSIRQEVCALMALDLLRRWMNGETLATDHGWVKIVESQLVGGGRSS